MKFVLAALTVCFVGAAVALGADELDVLPTLKAGPPPGTLLEVGTHTLSVTFTPEDTDNYNEASAQVELVVNEESEPPALSFEVKEGKLVLTYSGGSLQASTDLILWNPVEGAQGGKYEVVLPAIGKMFYRVAQ